MEDVDLIRGSQNFNPLIFFPPAMFDMIATSLMYVGLALTYSSSFQMLRGTFSLLINSEFICAFFLFLELYHSLTFQVR